MMSLSPHRIRKQALDTLHPSRGMVVLTYQETQALKDGHWDALLATANKRARRVSYAIWLLVVFLIASTSLHAFYAAGVASASWTHTLRELLIPGMWLPFGLYGLHAALKRSRELERVRTLLKTARDAENAASDPERA